jgi:DNA polymerase V
MIGAGINDGDEILVDRSLRPQDRDIVVATVDDEFTVKTLRLFPPRLEPANDDFPVIPIPEEEDTVQVWGVVTTVIHHVLRGPTRAR